MTKIDKFAFQGGWLQSIHSIVERGEDIATSYEQTDDPVDIITEEESKRLSVSYFSRNCPSRIPSHAIKGNNHQRKPVR